MKKILFFALAISAILFSCKDEDTVPTTTDFAYHAHINSPNSDDKHIDDTLHIDVDFESHTGEIVHHVNVRIYNADDNTEVYNKPTDQHVHAESGFYNFTDDFVLSNANGINEHTNWILEASVWSHEEGQDLETETVAFHVHP